MALFDFSNLPYWLLLGMGVLLFLVVILSGGGDDGIDLEADVEADLAVGDGADLDADVDAEAEFSLAQAIGWLGLGKAPLILLLATDLSLWGIWGWMLNVTIGLPLSRWLPGLAGGIIVAISLVLALLIGGQIAKPVGKVFASFGEDASSDRLIGCLGTVSTARLPLVTEGKIGQVDVLDSARNLVTVNATLPEWAMIIPQRGDKVLVIDRSPQGYLVIAKDSVDQESWLSNAADSNRRSRS